MATVFEHADGRIMVDEGWAGGTGGGVTHRFHRLATEAEAAEYRALRGIEPEVVAVVPEHEADAPVEAETQPDASQA